MIRSWRSFNYTLFGCVIVLIAFSLAMVYSATANVPYTQGYFSRHIVNIIVGAIVMVLLTVLDYHAFEAWVLPLYLATLLALGVVLAIGQVSSGAQSWLDFGIRTFQPSEPAKILVIVALAAFWARAERDAGTWRIFLLSLILAGVPTLLVFIQPDFGTAMVLSSIWLLMAWNARSRWWHLLILALAAIPVGWYGWNEVLQDYQRTRLLIFIDPLRFDPDLKEGAWNIIQALTAIGSGGMFGQGWTRGILSQGNYLPVQYSDFIFAVTGEELGFAGATLLLIFQLALIWQALSIGAEARDVFGRLIATGVAAMFICHVFVHVGMNMSIMPITGIPLPFVSYGGSFTLTSLAAIGLLQSIALRRARIVF